MIQKLSSKIEVLEKEIEKNKKNAGLVLIQIKALFATEIAKLVNGDQTYYAYKKLELVTRDVVITTPSYKNDGDDLIHPIKPEYENPLSAIHGKENWAHFKFETKNGSISQHLENSTTQYLTRREISSQGAEITKI